ncbi:hypothetical protein DFR50_14259 [Roseiarcus fermentans]|uniref:Uncharacterized protein n=1 Tax=Roseiarcus fermentans TaxID=1473586 RepID=A0A366EN62_9HYPH|nr:hypothetical protein [Roseiarcus fermentans]RBP03811.1 hypothetical protein DFR50_14259 [Roseiarcus fermentans]
MRIDRAAAAATAAAIRLRGQPVTFARLSGTPPNVVQTPLNGAAVTAFVEDYQADTTATAATGWSASQIGSMELGDRHLIVMLSDLAAAGFPGLPQKGDQVTLTLPAETLTITKVDPARRALAGAIDLYGVGLA